ncbi:MAG: hypothetical protein KA761_07285 [Gemmatimonadaceae bacterium]|nr:hypothetical protein [Gemmatimonadaceae bacterium]
MTRPAVQLAAERPFVVHVLDSETPAMRPCQVRHLRAIVREVRADTLVLDDAVTMRRAPRAPDCLRGRSGLVVLSEQPSVEAVTVRGHPWRTLGAVLLAIPFGVALTIMAILGPPT